MLRFHGDEGFAKPNKIDLVNLVRASHSREEFLRFLIENEIDSRKDADAFYKALSVQGRGGTEVQADNDSDSEEDD